ncbi:hypothetical protein ACFWUP_11405 [Nocardia sp. NPDC058658]|uniref:hypothetical protein n=1 Tax=Nocardia sp. NPDC058658 TaxID=3346580 RepID=UPI00365302E1
MRCSELSAGEVVYFPEGPFVGLSGVVLDVDAELSMLRVEFAEGLDHPGSGAKQQRRRTVTVAFDELELAV